MYVFSRNEDWSYLMYLKAKRLCQTCARKSDFALSKSWKIVQKWTFLVTKFFSAVDSVRASQSA